MPNSGSGAPTRKNFCELKVALCNLFLLGKAPGVQAFFLTNHKILLYSKPSKNYDVQSLKLIIMNKLFGDDELKFIATASKKDLENYWDAGYALSEAAEFKLLERGNKDLILAYSKRFAWDDKPFLKFLEMKNKNFKKEKNNN